MSKMEHAAPVKKKLLTPGVIVLLLLMANGAFFGLKRFIWGLGAVTNLDNFHPWGIWIAVDVASGVALAAGGFTTAALVEIFHKKDFHPLLRPALLTAMLGYTFVALGVMIDLGRYYNIWHPMLPPLWSGHSALFEVGMCVMVYLTVLYIEFLPVVVERFKGRVNLPGPLAVLNSPVERLLKTAETFLGKTIFFFTIAGVVLSCMHQSSLGTLLVLAPTKLHSLWWTPILPLLFLLSAFSVGYPMVIVESMLAAKTFRRRPEMDILAPFSRIIPIILGFYISAKVIDWVDREQLSILFNGSATSNICLLEFFLGAVVPFFMLLSRKVRRSASLLFLAALLVVLGVLFNRIDVFITAFHPPYASHRYRPSFGEVSVTLGMIAALMFLYRVCVTIFPILPGPVERKEVRSEAS